MQRMNAYTQFASVARESTDVDHPVSSGISVAFVLLLAIGIHPFLGMALFAQTDSSSVTHEGTESWTAITESKVDNVNDSRTIESHSRSGNRALDERSVQVRGLDGHLEPYQDIETETVQVDASTVRITTRAFAQDINKAKILVQVTEEEKHTLPSGDSNIAKITSNSDTNGKLQVVERETVESRKIRENMEETQTTIALPSINGLVPAVKTRETRKRGLNDEVESEKDTLLLDGGGNWQVNEIRKTTSRREGDTRISEERVSRLDAEGKLSEISRVLSKQTENSPAEKRATQESYSSDVPGTARDGSLHLVERTTAIQRSSSNGEQDTEQQVEKVDPGNPSSGLRVSVLSSDKVQPTPSGEQAKHTIQVRDASGSFDVVSVDTTKSDRIPTIQIQQEPAEKP